jgi:hypothetical protein
MSLEIITGLIGFAAAFLAKEGWDLIKKKKEDTEKEIRDALKENTAAITELKVAFQRAAVELKHLLDKVSSIPEIQKDLNYVGAKLRAMENDK